MTDPPDAGAGPAPPVTLRAIAERLRAAFAQERRAIAALDHARLDELASEKRDLAGRLAEAAAADPAGPELDRELLELLAGLRVEAQATALLAAAATAAVRALLGYEATGGYDRRARHVSAAPERVLATY